MLIIMTRLITEQTCGIQYCYSISHGSTLSPHQALERNKAAIRPRMQAMKRPGNPSAVRDAAHSQVRRPGSARNPATELGTGLLRTSAHEYRVPIGSWVRRLDLAMDDLPATVLDAFNVLEKLAPIFLSLPKLQILVVHAFPSFSPSSAFFREHAPMDVRIPDGAWDGLAATCGDSLLRLQFMSVHFKTCIRPPLPLPGGIMSGFLHLRRMDPGLHTSSDSGCALCLQRLPDLSSCVRPSPVYNITECLCEQNSSNSPYPHLSTVSFSPNAVRKSSSTRCFLTIQGPLMKTILLEFFVPGEHRMTLELLRQHCPDLTRIILVMNWISPEVYHHPPVGSEASAFIRLIPPTITHLGVALN